MADTNKHAQYRAPSPIVNKSRQVRQKHYSLIEQSITVVISRYRTTVSKEINTQDSLTPLVISRHLVHKAVKAHLGLLTNRLSTYRKRPAAPRTPSRDTPNNTTTTRVRVTTSGASLNAEINRQVCQLQWNESRNRQLQTPPESPVSTMRRTRTQREAPHTKLGKWPK